MQKKLEENQDGFLILRQEPQIIRNDHQWLFLMVISVRFLRDDGSLPQSHRDPHIAGQSRGAERSCPAGVGLVGEVLTLTEPSYLENVL